MSLPSRRAGISEDIITQLSKLRGLFVIARNSSFTYKGQSVDVKRIGNELGARHVLEGSVRKAGKRVRVSSQLLDALSGSNIWADRCDRQLADIFELQDEITNTIVATIEPAINEAEREAARRKPPETIGCWEAYQRGMWHLLRRNRDDFLAAHDLFKASCSLDPTFALPHAGLALVAFFQSAQGFASDEEAAISELMSEALTAVTLDPSESMARSALGLAYMKHGDFEKSIAEHRIAIELNPNSSFSHWAFGFALNLATHHDEGLEHFEMALRLSPKDPTTWTILTVMASALYHLKRYDEAARRAYEATANQTTDSLWPYLQLAAALGQLGRVEEAASIISKFRQRQSDFSISEIRKWLLMAGRPLDEGLRKAGFPD